MNPIIEAVIIGAIIAGIPLAVLMIVLLASKLPTAVETIKTKRKWRKLAPILKEIYMEKLITEFVIEGHTYPRVFHLYVNPYDPDSIKKAEEQVKSLVEGYKHLPGYIEPRFYGATWTYKGLIYVAEYVNGEWEVIKE